MSVIRPFFEAGTVFIRFFRHGQRTVSLGILIFAVWAAGPISRPMTASDGGRSGTALSPTPNTPAVSVGGERLTQVSTIDTLLAGGYDGVISLDRLTQYGTEGVGTVDRIDGELTLIGGLPYLTKGDGSVVIPPKETTVPFASVTTFSKDDAVALTIDHPLGSGELTALIDRTFPDPNLFVAVTAHGDFSGVLTRSEMGQTKPYRPLAETMKTAERTFALGDRSGDMVGFRTPPFMKGLNVPGFHFHFLDAERMAGGHLIDFRMESGRILLRPIREFLMILPDATDGAEFDLTRDRAAELQQVERLGQ